ncbi:MAG: alpha/beta hydrolase [Pseudomonadota bacterium]
MAVRSTGSGRPVVLLHSSASSSAQWRDAMIDMASAYRVFAPDFPGYGKSAGWSGTAPRTLATDCEVVSSISEDCREPIHLVGHSYGGAVALWYAMRYPQTVKSLTLIEPVAFNVLRFGARGRRFLFDEVEDVATTVVTALSRGDHFAGMAHFIDYWNGRGTWDLLPRERQELLATQIENIAQEFSAVFDDPRSTAAYEDLQVPTLIIRGDQSRVPAMSVAASLARAIPAAVLHTIEGAGHMLPLTHKSLVQTAISHHINRHAHSAVSVPALPHAA